MCQAREAEPVVRFRVQDAVCRGHERVSRNRLRGQQDEESRMLGNECDRAFGAPSRSVLMGVKVRAH